MKKSLILTQDEIEKIIAEKFKAHSVHIKIIQHKQNGIHHGNKHLIEAEIIQEWKELDI